MRQRLIEAELAQELDTSRFIVRNALLQLEADGLIEIQPNRGARVREITVEQAIEITDIRREVEGLVAARAAERVSEAEIAELRSLGDRMREAVAAGALTTYSDLNATLHARVRDIARHETAARILTQLNGQLVRHQFRLSLIPGRPATSLPEHLLVIDAICARDPEGARAAMVRHIDSVIATLSEPTSDRSRRLSEE